MAARRPRRARPFPDRRSAGRALADALLPLAAEHPVVLALPRGGVPVAFEVARALGAPLDVLLVRKVGAPGQPELGIGAVAEGGVRVLDPDTIRELRIGDDELARLVGRAEVELAAARERYGRPGEADALAGRTAIVIDDGLATGGTAHAAVRAVRARGAERIVLSVPVGSRQAIAHLSRLADEVVCLTVPAALRSIGSWYADFGQTSDAEVRELLARAAGDAP